MILSLNDDIAFPSTSDSPTITWDYPGLLEPGNENYQFQVAIGTIAGASDLQAWTNVGIAESFAATGISLSLGVRAYASVRIVDSTGRVYQTLAGDGWLPVNAVSSSARFAIAQNWNSYALRSNTTLTCTNDVPYFSCIHGGESRRVDFPSAANCSNLSAADSLNAFDWGCDDTGGAGNVFFFSRSLKFDKGLSDLVNATNWKNIRVVIFQSSTPIAASIYTTWWTNIVQDFPIAATSVVSNTIYTVSENRIGPERYIIKGVGATEVTGVGIVVLNGYSMTTQGFTLSSDILLETNCRFCWMEGTFIGNGFGHLTGGTKLYQSTLRKIKVIQFETFNQTSHSYCFVSNLYVYNNASGLRLEASFSNVYENIHIDRSGYGIYITDNESNNVFLNVTITQGSTSGIHTYINSNNHFIALTIADGLSPWSQIEMLTTTNMLMKNFLLVHNDLNTIFSNGDTRLTIDNVVTENILWFSNSNSKFTNNLIFTTLTPTCMVMLGASPGITNTTCANNGASNSTQHYLTDFGLNSFTGFISTNDINNTSDTSGLSDFSDIADWWNFDNLFRSWSADIVPKPKGACTTGPCRIYDYTLKTSDTVARNSSVTGNSQNANFVNGAACPAALHGNVVTVSAAVAPITYLTNAREIMGTGGNNNGLCQSNESCIYLPNFGSYQGNGDFWNNQCTFTNGVITGVKMYAYPLN